MMPAEIPPELSNLTSIEERLLCLIVPFLKIITLNNRLNQNWCKGQVILFVKDVSEIAEPLTWQHSGFNFSFHYFFDRLALCPSVLERIIKK